jgi:hypothetical protein
VKVPKGGGQPGADLEVRFVTEHVWPLDPTWDGQGEPPSVIRPAAKRSSVRSSTRTRRRSARRSRRQADPAGGAVGDGYRVVIGWGGS